MKKLTYMIGLLIFCQACFAQQKIRPLYIGDTMPDYRFPSMLQYSYPTLDIKSLRGKVVILDFWDSTCSSCIDFMPELQRLQDHFKDSIQVILVNGSARDSEEKIRKIIANIKKYRGNTVSLPIALCDSALLQYLPHRGRPFEVVIDARGKIVATTSAEDINEKNIRSVIDGQEGSFSLRNDFWDTNLPAIFSVGKQELNRIVSYSAFIKVGSFPYGQVPKYNDKQEVVGISHIYSLLSAYNDAYRKELFYDLPVVELHTKDPLFYNLPGKHEPEILLYDLTCLPGRFSDAYFLQALKQDLDRTFNFSLKREVKDTACLVIKVNKNIKNSYSKNAVEDGNIDHLVSASKNHIAVYQNAISVGSLMGWVNLALGMNTARPYKIATIIDESNDKNLIDIKFPAGFDLTDFEKVRTYLSSKGIDLSIEKRKIPVVVISDKKPGEPTVLN